MVSYVARYARDVTMLDDAGTTVNSGSTNHSFIIRHA